LTELLVAGRIGRPHGLDGSFHVVDPAPDLLPVGAEVLVGGAPTEIVARKGTDAQPILRLAAAGDREGAVALCGRVIEVPRTAAPSLGEDEYWADDLVGCRVVVAGERVLGSVVRMIAYPSCEVLELDCDGLLIPLVKDAVVRVDLGARRIEVDPGFLGL
jgi:16S rRNA processing protein RimM